MTGSHRWFKDPAVRLIDMQTKVPLKIKHLAKVATSSQYKHKMFPPQPTLTVLSIIRFHLDFELDSCHTLAKQEVNYQLKAPLLQTMRQLAIWFTPLIAVHSTNSRRFWAKEKLNIHWSLGRVYENNFTTTSVHSNVWNVCARKAKTRTNRLKSNVKSSHSKCTPEDGMRFVGFGLWAHHKRMSGAGMQLLGQLQSRNDLAAATESSVLQVQWLFL